MNCSLIYNEKGYQVNYLDALTSFATGFSGLPFAIRHYQLSQGNWEHLVLSGIECLPLLGGTVALIEKVAASYQRTILEIPWRTSPLSSKKAMKEMLVNGKKAILQHRKISWAYAPLREALPTESEFAKKEEQPLLLKMQMACDIGPRAQMEDAHLYQETDEGVLTGVFDGHGGKDVSAFASREFSKHFSATLAQTNQNVHQTFERLIHHIHEKIAENPQWNHQGSTAVISYIDKKTHLIYTANLGDSEANIYRKTSFCFWKTIKSIPLSRVLDWTHPEEKKRLETTFGKKLVTKRFKEMNNRAKFIRSHLFFGVNVSRALGDISETGTKDYPLVIHEPTITINKLQKGDILVLACDGLKDYVPENHITKIINRLFQQNKKEVLAQSLVDYAIKDKRSEDNVSVIGIEVA